MKITFVRFKTMERELEKDMRGAFERVFKKRTSRLKNHLQPFLMWIIVSELAMDWIH